MKITKQFFIKSVLFELWIESGTFFVKWEYDETKTTHRRQRLFYKVYVNDKYFLTTGGYPNQSNSKQILSQYPEPNTLFVLPAIDDNE